MTLPMLNNQSLKNFLRKQPPDKKYSYFDNRNCCICKYFQSYGFTDVQVDGEFYRLEAGYKRYPLPEGWDQVAQGEHRFLHPWEQQTFGNAYRRAMELLD